MTTQTFKQLSRPLNLVSGSSRSRTVLCVIASCLALQLTTAFSGDTKSTSADSLQLDSLGIEIPLYHQSQAREILGQAASLRWDENSDAFQGRSIELTHYIHGKVRDLLPKPWRPKTSRIAKTLIETANKYHMDPLFLMAVIEHESRFNPEVIGSHGEIGLMQIKPETARHLLAQSIKDRDQYQDLSEDQLATLLHDPETNISVGAAFLAQLRTRYKGKSALYISAYNMGPTAMRRHLAEGTQPKEYLSKVLAKYAALTEGYSPDLFSNVAGEMSADAGVRAALKASAHLASR